MRLPAPTLPQMQFPNIGKSNAFQPAAFDFLGLKGFKCEHYWHTREELKSAENTKSYFLNHHHKYIKYSMEVK